MLVLNTTSPVVSPAAPKARPVYTVPSSSANFAVAMRVRSPGRARLLGRAVPGLDTEAAARIRRDRPHSGVADYLVLKVTSRSPNVSVCWARLDAGKKWARRVRIESAEMK